MCEAARQLSNSLHFLCLIQRTLCLQTFGDLSLQLCRPLLDNLGQASLVLLQREIHPTPLQHHLDGGMQLAFGERLQKVAIGGGGPRTIQRQFFGICGKIDHRDRQLSRHPSCGFNSINLILNMNVHQHEIGMQGLDVL